MKGPRIGDAFGACLLDCLASGPRPAACSEVVEREDGLIGVSDAYRYFAPHGGWSELEAWAYAQIDGRALDVGAGAGRLALSLQEDGCDVTALDTSPSCVEVYRRRGVHSTFSGSVVDLARRKPDERFDSVLLFGNNLGLPGNRTEARNLFAALDQIVTPGGCITGTGSDPRATDDELHLRYHDFNRERGREPGQLRIRVRHGDLATPWFDYLFVSVEDLDELVADCGWSLEEVRDGGGGNYAATIRSRGRTSGRRADESELQRDVDALVSLGIVGVQARVDTDNGQYELATGGVADLRTGHPVPADGHFRIASATKTFVATVALQLAGEDRLSLTDPVERWLASVVGGPGFDGADLTIRQLLQHTSGLHDDDPGSETPADYYRGRDRIRTPQELVAQAMRHRLDFRPGTSWGYSNTGYLLLGMVIERITGQPWYEEVTSRILRPLRLRHISFPENSPLLPAPHAHGYQLFAGTDQPVDVTAVVDANASDGLIGTTADLNRFYQTLLAGRLLKPAEQAQLRHTVPVDDTTQQFWPGGEYGLGLVSRPLSCGGVYWGHEGGQLGYITLNGVTDTGTRAVTLSMSAAVVDHAPQQEELASALIDHALCA